MRTLLGTIVCFTALLIVQPATASTISVCGTTTSGAISCTGALDTPEDIFEIGFTVPAGGPLSITIQTFGFGGGTNAAGTAILPGGFDSLVALFSGPPETILTDSAGNPVASAANLFPLFSGGCPPAGTVTVGTVGNVCADNTLTASLLPGTYTLLLTDANYVPFAVNPGPPLSTLLSDGFADLSGAVFQTCVTSTDCNTDTGNFAVDIVGLPATPVPELGTYAMLLAGLGLLGFAARRRKLKAA